MIPLEVGQRGVVWMLVDGECWGYDAQVVKSTVGSPRDTFQFAVVPEPEHRHPTARGIMLGRDMVWVPTGATT